MLLPYVEKTTHPTPTATIIWLHGLGADGHDFASVIPELHLPSDLALRFIFPHAPAMPVTINGGYVMPAWYDILAMDIDREVDEVQLRQSAAEIVKFIEHEKTRGIASNRILVVGFSQGGAVAYEVALSYSQPLAGLLALSTYFATKNSVVLHEANQNLPIEIHHGAYDGVVPNVLGQQALALLQQKKYTVKYREYAMEHSVSAEQLTDIGQFIQQILA
ncbi:MAG: dienelactone hydrolase family protein [Marinagarivorans sp.]|nr:dienelactone hydrolase family protein [Marinagarivorans sp.]